MEKISSIIKEVKEKRGKEWLSLQPKAEQQLESLVWYLDHPKLQEDPEKVEEIVELYYNAKSSGFLRMERITRKLDELSVKIGKVGSIEKEVFPAQLEIKPKEKPKQPTIVNHAKAIEELRNRIERLLNSPSGSSLLESTQNSIIIFLNYLNHPDLQNNTELFNEMLNKYEEVEAVDFIPIHAFNNLLNKIQMKLGKATEEMKTWKSIDEREKDLTKEMKKIEEEKESLKEGWKELEAKRENLKVEWQKLEVEREKLKEELEAKSENLKVEYQKLDREKEKLKVEREKFNEKRQKFATERVEITLERANLESEKEKLEEVRKQLEAMQNKLERELSRIP